MAQLTIVKGYSVELQTKTKGESLVARGARRLLSLKHHLTIRECTVALILVHTWNPVLSLLIHISQQGHIWVAKMLQQALQLLTYSHSLPA